MEQHDGSSWDWAGVRTPLVEPNDLVLAARGIIAARAVLADKMPPGFTGEPALIILLHLFVERENGETRTMLNLMAATRLAAAPVARWCKALEHQNLLRSGSTIELTEVGVALVTDMVRAVIESHARLLGMPPAA